MIEKKQEEIIKKINNTKEVKQMIKLKEKLNSNNKYKELLKEAEKENANILEIRKELFKIKEFKEYNELYIEIKLTFIKINKIITSIVNNKKCKVTK